jgi:glycosidase
MLLYGKIDGSIFTAAVVKASMECGDSIFKSWNILSTHDTPRIKNIFGDLWKIAVILQFTVPGSPLIYYGEEIGMQGEGDPYCRQPMLWQGDLRNNDSYNFYLKLIDEYKNVKGINCGKIKQLLASDKEIVCFERSSNEIRDTRWVIVNPTNKEISTCIITDNSSLMNYSKIRDVFSETEFEIFSSCIDAVIPPKFAGVFKIDEEKSRYNSYKRIP